MIATSAKLAGLFSAIAVLVTPAAFAASAGHTKPTKPAGAGGAWKFPSCTVKAPEYDYVYSGDPCDAVSAAGSTASLPVIALSAPVVVVHVPGCAGNPDYDYIWSPCQP